MDNLDTSEMLKYLVDNGRIKPNPTDDGFKFTLSHGKIDHVDIKSGLWDHRCPPHEELLAWLERVPFTWLPELLSTAISQSIVRGKFSDEEILDFCKSSAEASTSRAETFPDTLTDSISKRLPV